MKYLKINEKISRTIVVGDIHGCMDELSQLLEEVVFCDDDLLVSVGDMVDRGPASWDVARFFRGTPNAISCMGNHERRVAGTVRGTSEPAWTQRQTLSLLPQEDWNDWANWFADLPLVVETPHAVVAHARIDPVLSLGQQEEKYTCAVGGHMVKIELDDHGVPVWFKEGAFEKPVCFGHARHARVELVPGKLFALDTGVARGKALTAVIFPEGKIVTVDSGADYYSCSLRDWKLAENARLAEMGQLSLFEAQKVYKNTNNIGDDGLLRARARIKDLVSHLNLAEVSADLSSMLHDFFGEPPEPGPDRRDFYVGLRDHFSSSQVGSVAYLVYRGDVISLKELVLLGPRRLLCEMEALLAEFSAEVKTVCQRTGDDAGELV